MNATVATPTRLLEVDALWPTERVIVELDGAAVHRTAKAFHDDRRRDAALAAEGYIVIRLTGQRVTQEAEAVIPGFTASSPAGPAPSPPGRRRPSSSPYP
jgi:very-short-patch-repair endonuclease